MSVDAAETWTRLQSALRHEVSDGTYELWLSQLELAGVSGSVVSVTAPPSVRSWVADRFADALDRAAVAALGPGARVELHGEGAAAAPTPRRGRGRSSAPPPEPPPGSVRDELNPKFTFEQFILGDGNRFAHAAALAVAELPAQAYNPLFLYGPPGVGKTHLLHAIGNYVHLYGGGATVRCTTAEAFTNAFLGAIHGGNVEHFKTRFRGVDVLLIDDVQFLESKTKTEEEFFHTFNALRDQGSQVVLTSDRLPRDFAALEERLLERFESGLVADIAPPDLNTRMTVLRKRVQLDDVTLEDESALRVIAERIDSNMRALEGALIRVVAYQSLTARPLDAALAEEVLDGLYAQPGRRGRAGQGHATPTVDRILDATGELFGITREELLSDSRTARVAWPRQVAMYLAREHTGQSLPAIGRSFGGRNHTTVLHACKRTAERVAADPEASETVRTLAERIHDDRRD
jgi:chromosomal replication initiator protein